MTTSSITAALPGTASSTSRGQSCPSACAIGHIGPDQRDLVLDEAFSRRYGYSQILSCFSRCAEYSELQRYATKTVRPARTSPAQNQYKLSSNGFKAEWFVLRDEILLINVSTATAAPPFSRNTILIASRASRVAASTSLFPRSLTKSCCRSAARCFCSI